MALAIASSLFLIVARGHAAVYRCTLPDGQISYQQTTCKYASEPLQLRPASKGWTGLRPAERALLESRRKQRLTPRHRPSDAKKAPADKNNKACWSKRRQLEAVRDRLRRGYTLKQSAELHRKRDTYQDYLRQFCS